ncbi:thioesterase family protein [Streptomyces sp. NPDC048473]|uniref:thioesterase family protein n=2 Tax=unclassified Streptomyces TaxID=2593676 RepID=UPI00371EA297
MDGAMVNVTAVRDVRDVLRSDCSGNVTIDPSWWSWAGAHGGYVAALALTEMRAHLSEQHGEPGPVQALSAHFLAPVDERPLTLNAVVERAGRRASVSTFSGEQDGTAVLVGSAVFGAAGLRPGSAPDRGPGYDGLPMPALPEAARCEPQTLPMQLAAFAQYLEIRPATAARPLAGGPDAELTAWVRFVDGRPLDAEALVVLVDALPPALFACWTVPRPVPTAQLTVHFTDALVSGPVQEWALVRIRTEHAGSGWAVDDSAVWAADGRLLALARQSRTVLGEQA